MMAAVERRAVELLVDRATEGLDPAAESELDSLLVQLPEIDPESFELAAAAVDLAFTIPETPLPERLRQQVTSRASEYFDARASAEDGEDLAEIVPLSPRPPRDVSRWLGWMAAAAAILIAISSWLPDRPVSRSDAQSRAELIARSGELIELEWTATEDPAAADASGDVVWSQSEQAGFMRFRGLPVNDPNVSQYQLWIFDGTRDDRFPVDGGVFDIPDEGETVVPIDARLRIDQPALFAITIETPGGVVVSNRERLPLLAQVG